MISFRFKSEKTFDTLRFMGEQISSGELRKQIEEKRIRKREAEVGKKWESYELLLLEEHTNKSIFYVLTRIHK
jgi:DWNN domain